MMDFSDKLLWITVGSFGSFVLAVALATLSWRLGNNDEPVDEVREERRERRNGEVAKSDGR